MDYKWEIIRCNVCNNYHAIPFQMIKEIHVDEFSKITCPYCTNKIIFQDEKQGRMSANRGLIIEQKMSE